MIHTNQCTNGYYKLNSFRFINNEPVPAIVDSKCYNNTAVFSYNFEIFYVHYGSCVLNHFNERDLIKNIVKQKYNVDLVAFRSKEPPEWNSYNDYVYELVFLDSTNNMWDYYKKTNIEHVSNIFCKNPIQKDLLYESQNIDAYNLFDVNVELMKRNKFVSKRSSHYEITTADINILLNKFSNQIKQKS